MRLRKWLNGSKNGQELKLNVKKRKTRDGLKELAIKAETIGMLAVTKEKSADKPDVVPAAEKHPKAPEPLKAPERPERSAEMSVAELLVIAAHIPAEQGSVKKAIRKKYFDRAGFAQNNEQRPGVNDTNP